MKKTIRFLLLFILLFLLAFVVAYVYIRSNTSASPADINKKLKIDDTKNEAVKALHTKAISAKQFAGKNKYNNEVMFPHRYEDPFRF